MKSDIKILPLIHIQEKASAQEPKSSVFCSARISSRVYQRACVSSPGAGCSAPSACPSRTTVCSSLSSTAHAALGRMSRTAVSCSPVSSRSSRRAASSGVSLPSISPPGRP